MKNKRQSLFSDESEIKLRGRAWALEALKRSEENLRVIFHNVHDAIFIHAPNGDIIDVNNKMLTMYGVDRAQALAFSIIKDYSSPDNPLDQLHDMWQRAMAGETILFEWKARRPLDGLVFDVEVSLCKIKLYYNQEVILATVRDITERKHSEEQARQMGNYLSLLMESTVEGIYGVDINNQCNFINHAGADMLGITREEAIGKNMHIFMHYKRIDGQYYPWEECKVCEVMSTGQGRRVDDEVFWRTDGTFFPVEYTAYPLLTDGIVQGAVVIFQDISKRKNYEEKIRFQAYHDALTGLPNRLLFHDRLLQEMAHARRNKRRVAVAFLDLDSFKQINDTLGHDVGDLLLKAVAERLTQCIRAGDTVARMGGDEFTLILPEMSREGVTLLVERVLQAVRAPYRIHDRPIAVTTSIGVSLFPDDGEDVQALMKKADTAMYVSKENGRNRYTFYNWQDS